MNEYIHRKLFENKLLVCLFVCLFSLPLKGYGQDTNWTDYANPTWNKTTVASAADLAALANAVNNGESFEGKTIKLIADIDLSAHMWTPIGLKSFFKGDFEGNNKTISNINACIEGSSVGLFSAISIGTIRNLTINGFNGKGRVVGAIAGSITDGSVQNCHTIGSIHMEVTEEAGGGIIGTGGSEPLSNCTNSATVTIEINVKDNSVVYVGGIAGNPPGYTNNCSNTGDISVIVKKAVNIAVGGISGTFYTSEIRNCKNSGDISIKGNSSFSIEAGGVAGKNDDSDVMGCSNTGKLTVTGAEHISAGGVVGVNSSSFYPSETIPYQSYLKNCYNKGQIVAEGASCVVGGIVGSSMHSPIENSYNTGDIEATGQTNQEEITLNAGGITGRGFRECRIKNCYNTGNIRSSGSATTWNTILSGGIIGESSANVHMIAVYNVGNVSAETTGDETYTFFGAGGIAGTNDSPNVKNSLALGGMIQINKGDHVGRIVGSKNTYSKLTNCYSSTKMVTQSGNNIIVAPEAKNGIDWYYTMKEPFNQWDNSIWEMSETDLPRLKDLEGQPQLLKSDYAEKEKVPVMYHIKYVLENIQSNSLPLTVDESKQVAFTLVAATNYKLPATIVVSMGGATLEAGTAYTYDAATGKVSIPAATGDIVIKADGVADKPLPPAIGDTFTSGSLQYIVTADKTVGVHKATDLSQSEYILPATIEQGGLTYKITTIEAHAFDIADIQLTSVKIPEGVISIGEDAFVGCEKLAHVELPSTVLTIDKSAFAWCSSLTSFTVPANLKVIDDRVFRGSGLVSVIISAGVESIRDLAFGDCNALKEINMQGMTPPQLDFSEPEENCACGHPFEQVNKTTCKVYVPRGSASAYAGWGGFTSILEEGNSPQSNDATLKTLSYRIGTDSPLEIQSFSSGQYEYTVELPEKTGSEAQITLLGTPNHVTAKLSEDNTVNLVQGKGTVTLQVTAEDGKTTKSYTVHFEVSVPKAIIPDDPNEEIVVGADNTYTDSRGNTSVFNGEVGSGTETTLVGKLTFDNPESGTASTSIILNKVRVGDMNSAELSTLVTSTTGIVINLKGENSLGKLVNNGSISLESIGDAILMNTVVENNGVFTDKTSSLAKVEGPASLDITPPEDNEVAPGSTTTLSASTATGTDYAVTFTWEEQQPDGSWKQTGTPNTYTPTRSGLRAGGIMIKDELKIKASKSGKYRCVIMNKVGVVSTTLTTQPATVTVNSTVGNAVIDNRKSVRVQDGVVYIQVPASELIQIVNYSGTIVRSLRLPIGETRVENLQHGFYIIKFEDKQTQKVTVR